MYIYTHTHTHVLDANVYNNSNNKIIKWKNVGNKPSEKKLSYACGGPDGGGDGAHPTIPKRPPDQPQTEHEYRNML